MSLSADIEETVARLSALRNELIVNAQESAAKHMLNAMRSLRKARADLANPANVRRRKRELAKPA